TSRCTAAVSCHAASCSIISTATPTTPRPTSSTSTSPACGASSGRTSSGRAGAMATSSRPRSVVRRVFALTALWAIGLSLALAGLALWQYWRVSVRALDARIAADAVALGRQIVVTDGVVEVEIPGELRLAASEGDGYYGVYDEAGRLLDGDAPPLPPDEVRRTGSWTVGGHREHRVDVTADGPP